jgi:hypothetical protein
MKMTVVTVVTIFCEPANVVEVRAYRYQSASVGSASKPGRNTDQTQGAHRFF